MVTAGPSHMPLVHVHTQILSKGSAGSDLNLSKTEEQGSVVTPWSGGGGGDWMTVAKGDGYSGSLC